MMRIKLTLLLILSICSLVRATDRATLKSMAKQQIARENDTYTLDSTWNHALNQALNEVTEKCSCVVAYDTIVVTADQREDTLNTNFSKIWSVYSATNKKVLQQVLAEQKGLLPNSETNSPIYFYIQGRRIGWDIIPSLEDSMFLTYFPSYKKLTADTMLTNIPTEFDNAIVLYTCHYELLRERDPDAALFLLEADKKLAEVRVNKLRTADLLKLQKKIP